jgi:hypothetical protein
MALPSYPAPLVGSRRRAIELGNRTVEIGALPGP